MSFSTARSHICSTNKAKVKNARPQGHGLGMPLSRNRVLPVGGGGSGEWLFWAGQVLFVFFPGVYARCCFFKHRVLSHSRPSIVTSLHIIYYSWQTPNDVKEKIKSKVVLTSMAQWHSAAKLIKFRPGIAQTERFGQLDSKHVAKPNVTRLLLPHLLESVYKHYLQWHNSRQAVSKKSQCGQTP